MSNLQLTCIGPYDVPRLDPEAVRVLGVAWLHVAAADRRRGRCGDHAPRNVPARAGARPLERGVCPAVTAPGGWTLRREPQSPAQASPVSGRAEAGAR